MQSNDYRGMHPAAWKRSHCNSCHATHCLETYHNKVVVLSSILQLILQEEGISLPILVLGFFFQEV